MHDTSVRRRTNSPLDNQYCAWIIFFYPGMDKISELNNYLD